MTYGFRRLTPADLPLANGWIARPDVARWWDDPLEPADLHAPDHRLWLVSLGERPFAFIQDYDPHAEPGHPFADLPPAARGIDQFIGEPSLMDRGHGSTLIRQHVERLFAEGAPAVGADPHPDNARAIRAYEKAGFTAGARRDTPWGPALLMTTYRP